MGIYRITNWRLPTDPETQPLFGVFLQCTVRSEVFDTL